MLVYQRVYIYIYIRNYIDIRNAWRWPHAHAIHDGKNPPWARWWESYLSKPSDCLAASYAFMNRWSTDKALWIRDHHLVDGLSDYPICLQCFIVTNSIRYHLDIFGLVDSPWCKAGTTSWPKFPTNGPTQNTPRQHQTKWESPVAWGNLVCYGVSHNTDTPKMTSH